MDHKRLVAITAAAALGAGGLGAGLALSFGGGSGLSARALRPASTKASYAYYLTVAKRLAGGQGAAYGPMMGGGPGSTTGGSGYSWMMGGSSAPGWMTGGSLPASMMGGSHDPGDVMGKLFANAARPPREPLPGGAARQRGPLGRHRRPGHQHDHLQRPGRRLRRACEPEDAG